jgi:WhiB family redox-sensing transcriptional regulator
MYMSISSLEWTAAAACRNGHREVFFPPAHLEHREERSAREELAKRICKDCPVRLECLDQAVSNREIHGIWGGLNEEERRRLTR